MTTKTGEVRDDACGEGRAGGEGSINIDAVVGFTFGVDDGSGLGGAGAQVGWVELTCWQAPRTGGVGPFRLQQHSGETVILPVLRRS